MVGGMLSWTILTLLGIPAIYALVKCWQLQRSTAAAGVADKRPGRAPRSGAADYREEATLFFCGRCNRLAGAHVLISTGGLDPTRSHHKLPAQGLSQNERSS
jgi:hypothetical protein